MMSSWADEITRPQIEPVTCVQELPITSTLLLY